MSSTFKQLEDDFKKVVKDDEKCFHRIFGYAPERNFQHALQKLYDTGICQKSDKEYIINVHEAINSKENNFDIDVLQTKIKWVQNTLRVLIDFFNSDCFEDENGILHIIQFGDESLYERKARFQNMIEVFIRNYNAFRQTCLQFFKI